MEYTTRSPSLQKDAMPLENQPEDDGNPKFGKLLVVLFLAVVFCAILTWVMGAYFPNFPGA
ncbi:hypothetical protein YQ44_04345 [Janthinobacterium sp. 1_2014MBL_MicDiv]|nr:hypothetical protein YQ44_04345 [Janthinobacterium sp. 1_2014MBL_MicDiv]